MIATDLQLYMELKRAGSSQKKPRIGQHSIRVAIVSDHATQQYSTVLKGAFDELDYFPVVFEAEYGTAALEAFDRDSKLHAFKPEIIVYSICVQNYRNRFYDSKTLQERELLPDCYLEEVASVVDALTSSGGIIVINNLALPIERQFGNFGLQTLHSLYGSVLHFNYLLAKSMVTRQSCAINDVMYLANRVGTEQFFDERLWFSAKYPCANRFLPMLARGVVRTALVRKGNLTKVLVLDLDNTLWGGVIGDDGLEGIRLGGNAEGESFKQFQSYIKSLKDRGYILTVCSKNNESIAMEVFHTHQEMVLQEEDIALFVINWNDKASNIEYISRVLNLGLDSFVFIDDMPFERELVRRRLPMVKVPEMPEDVTDYIAAIEKSGILENIGFSKEDHRRNSSYREEAKRTSEQLKYGSIDDYLISLDMTSECNFFKKEDIVRVAQLIQRSNQFNLRTQRLTAADCLEYLEIKNKKMGIQIKLSDKFGDYGLIAVICCDIDNDYLFITELVMSCRVLKRGVENLIMNFLFSQCVLLNLKGIKGEYISTSKNSLVKDFFPQFGFTSTQEEPKKTSWLLLASNYQPQKAFIS